jgi:hypothetical protein
MGLLGQIIEGFKRNSRRSEIRKGTMIQLVIDKSVEDFRGLRLRIRMKIVKD